MAYSNGAHLSTCVAFVLAVSAAVPALGAQSSDDGIPSPDDFIKVLLEGSYNEAANLAIKVIGHHKKTPGDTAGPLVLAMVPHYRDPKVSDERRKMLFDVISAVRGTEATVFLREQLAWANTDEAFTSAAKAAGVLLASPTLYDEKSLGRRDDERARKALQDELIDFLGSREDAKRAAAMDAIQAARIVEAGPALISILEEKGKDSRKARKALEALAGKRLPGNVDAWDSWHYYVSTPVDERETDEERSERTMRGLHVRNRQVGGRQGRGMGYGYLIIAIGGLIGAGGLLAYRALKFRRQAKSGIGGREKRKALRLQQGLDIAYRFLSHDKDFETKDPVQSKTIDLSSTGLQMEIEVAEPAWLPKIKSCRMFFGLEISLPKSSRPLRSFAEARWIRPLKNSPNMFRVGLAFTEMARIDKDRLQRYVVRIAIVE